MNIKPMAYDPHKRRNSTIGERFAMAAWLVVAFLVAVWIMAQSYVPEIGRWIEAQK